MKFSYTFQQLIEKNANHEQLVAITTSGGHILSAGAGSGKTYVLVHHALLKTEKIIFNNWQYGTEQILSRVKKFFCETVLMTFTKKAAFEIQIRMRSAIEKFISEITSECEDDKELIQIWQSVQRLIDSLNIVTIDGFCFKLVSSGLLPSVSSSPEIVEYWQSQLKIEGILKTWAIEFCKQKGIREAVVDSKIDLDFAAKNIAAIYADPLKHFEWSKKIKFNFSIGRNDYQKVFLLYLDFIGYGKLRTKYLSSKNEISALLQGPSNNQKESKWYENYKIFEKVLCQENYDFLAFTKSWKTAYSSVARLTIPKNVGRAIAEFFEELSCFRKQFLEMHDVFIRFETDLDTINDWLDFHKEMYSYCEKYYYTDNKITFSDLEYLVCKALHDEQISRNLEKYYNFFIIDEFQDTSEIQFLIVQKIINYSSDKLFVVGDVKQAIYGFRGGEVEVFKKTSDFLTTKLSLVQNYRSSPHIINFNNLLFEYILSQKHLSNNSSGLDPAYFSKQVPPDFRKINKQLITKPIQRNVAILNLPAPTSSLKLSGSEVEDLEAIRLLIRIKELVPNEEVTVLYSKLRPSLKLIKILIKEGIAFQAQAKVSLGESPIYGILKLFIKYLIYKEDGELLTGRAALLLEEIELNIIIYCCLISKNQYLLSQKIELENSFTYYKLLGPFESFRVFLLNLGISSPDLPSELEKIERYFKDLKDNIYSVYSFLNKRSAEESNIHFCWGQGTPRVKIMTVHASKGLEFENVLLGGVSSNGIRSQSREDIGADLASFKYRFNREKIKRKTPWYLYEKKLSEEKEQAESLRLFYVACTRAISRLEWFEIWPDGATPIVGTNSWLSSFCAFFEVENHSHLVNTEKVNIPLVANLKSITPPLIYFGTQELFCNIEQKGPAIGIMAEMSVTKFSTLAECPHKYYLKDILKIDDNLLMEKNELLFSTKIECEEEREGEGKIFSSAERGTFIHQEISNFIRTNNSTALYKVLPKENVEWLQNYFNETKKQYQNEIEMVVETQFKFSLFHQMLSAIPDLLIKKSNEKSLLEIWDFKTGDIKNEILPKYWTQLMAYAYGQYQLLSGQQQNPVKLKIIYVDKKHIEEKILSQNEIGTSLYQTWLKLSNLNHYNSDSCSSCSFKSICVHCTDTGVC